MIHTYSMCSLFNPCKFHPFIHPYRIPTLDTGVFQTIEGIHLRRALLVLRGDCLTEPIQGQLFVHLLATGLGGYRSQPCGDIDCPYMFTCWPLLLPLRKVSNRTRPSSHSCVSVPAQRLTSTNQFFRLFSQLRDVCKMDKEKSNMRAAD